MPLAKLQYPKTLTADVAGDTSLYSTNLFYSNSPLYNVFSSRKSTYAPPYNLNSSISNTTLTFKLLYLKNTTVNDLSFIIDGVLYKNNTVINGSNVFLKSNIGNDVQNSFINMVKNSQLGEDYNISTTSLTSSGDQYYLNVLLTSKIDGNSINPVISTLNGNSSLIVTQSYNEDIYQNPTSPIVAGTIYNADVSKTLNGFFYNPFRVQFSYKTTDSSGTYGMANNFTIDNIIYGNTTSGLNDNSFGYYPPADPANRFLLSTNSNDVKNSLLAISNLNYRYNITFGAEVSFLVSGITYYFINMILIPKSSDSITVTHSIGNSVAGDVDNYEIGIDILKNQEYLTSPSTVNRIPSLITSISKKGFSQCDFDLSNIIDNSIDKWKPVINGYKINFGKWIDLFSTNYWQKYVDKQTDPNNTYANKVYQTASTDLTFTTITIYLTWDSYGGTPVGHYPGSTPNFDINGKVSRGLFTVTDPYNQFIGFSPTGGTPTGSTPVKNSITNMFTLDGTLSKYDISFTDYSVVTSGFTFYNLKIVLTSKIKGDTIHPVSTTSTSTSTSLFPVLSYPGAPTGTYYNFITNNPQIYYSYGTTSYTNDPQQMYFYSIDGREPLFENIDYSNSTSGFNTIQNNLSNTAIIDTNIDYFYNKNLTNQPSKKQLNRGYEILCNAKKTIALPGATLYDKVIFDITYLDNTTEQVSLNTINVMGNQSFYYINQLSFKVNDLNLHTTSGISMDNLKYLDVHFEYPNGSNGYVYETQSYFKDTTIQTCDDNTDPNVDYLTIVFKNGKGGFDIFEFNEVTDNNTVRTIQTLDKPYTWKNKKTSEFSSIWNMTYTKSFTTTTRTLSNEEFKWLEDLIKSKEVYAMHPTTQELYPIIIIDDDYNYKKNTDLTVSITYTYSRPEVV